MKLEPKSKWTINEWRPHLRAIKRPGERRPPFQERHRPFQETTCPRKRNGGFNSRGGWEEEEKEEEEEEEGGVWKAQRQTLTRLRDKRAVDQSAQRAPFIHPVAPRLHPACLLSPPPPGHPSGCYPLTHLAVALHSSLLVQRGQSQPKAAPLRFPDTSPI